jgi:transposase
MVMPVVPFEKTFADGAEAKGGRRPSLVSAPSAASPELGERPRRRTFAAGEKLRILRQVDEAGPGGIGAILRREGLYSSQLSEWRQQRDAGGYEALKAVRRGPKVEPIHPLAAENAQLQRDNKRLTLRLQRAEAIIEVQKKVALLLGLSMPIDEPS